MRSDPADLADPGSVGLALVWAQARGGVIGRDGGLPWHLPEDLARFKELTWGGVVVMGRRTWESLPERFRPLPGRRNLVLSRDPAWTAPGAERVGSLSDALRSVEAGQPAGQSWLWVIGGGQLYREAVGPAARLEVTELDLDVDGDTLAPVVDPAEWVVSPGPWQASRAGIRYRFVRYDRLAQAAHQE